MCPTAAPCRAGIPRVAAQDIFWERSSTSAQASSGAGRQGESAIRALSERLWETARSRCVNGTQTHNKTCNQATNRANCRRLHVKELARCGVTPAEVSGPASAVQTLRRSTNKPE